MARGRYPWGLEGGGYRKFFDGTFHRSQNRLRLAAANWRDPSRQVAAAIGKCYHNPRVSGFIDRARLLEELSKVSSGKFVRASLLEGTLKVSSGKLVGPPGGKSENRRGVQKMMTLSRLCARKIRPEFPSAYARGKSGQNFLPLMRAENSARISSRLCARKIWPEFPPAYARGKFGQNFLTLMRAENSARISSRLCARKRVILREGSILREWMIL